METSARVVIALDVGLKRIGVAKSILGIPVCLDPIFRKNRNQAANAVRALVMEAQASVLVVGIPEDAVLKRRILHFVSLLQLEGLPIVFLDESFSSQEALERLTDKTMRKKAHSRDGSLDSLAALVILERYLMRQKQH